MTSKQFPIEIECIGQLTGYDTFLSLGCYNPLSTVGTSVARSSGSLYSLSEQSPIGNPLLTIVDVASRS